jgi:hypothetical protein
MKSGVNNISQLSGQVIGFYYRFRTFSTDSLASEGGYENKNNIQYLFKRNWWSFK